MPRVCLAYRGVLRETEKRRNLLHRQIGAFNQLFIMNADGTNVQQLTFEPAHSLFTNPGNVRVHSE